MDNGHLLLSPRGPRTARNLIRPSHDRKRAYSRREEYVLPVIRDALTSFATLGIIIRDLKHRERTSSGLAALDRVEQSILRVQAEEQELHAQGSLHGAALASKGTLATLRRVTRESAGTAVLIDRAARAIVAALKCGHIRRVVVPEMERIDRPSLKAIARACLIADGSTTWEWQLGAALAPGARQDSALVVPSAYFRETRSDLLRRVCSVLQMDPVTLETAPQLEHPAPSGATLGTACAWLNTQNYDACFLWLAETLGAERNAPIDALRLLAMTATIPPCSFGLYAGAAICEAQDGHR